MQISAERYIDRILMKYSSSYDIFRPFEIGGKSFDAYGRYSATKEKYVLSRKANLWTINGFEHVLFRIVQKATKEDVDDALDMISEHMEPELVRGGRKYPEKDHMISCLTVVLISRERPDEAAAIAAKRLRFDKGYLFSFRGHSEGHMILAEMETETVYTNFAARHLKKTYLETFAEVRGGKPGFSEVYDETVL